MFKKTLYFLTLILIIFVGIFIFPSQFHRKITPDATVSTKSLSVTLRAASSSYPFTIPENKNIYDLMNAVASTTSFTFQAKYYSGLGYFIEAIQGISNNNGYYWTLYTNNTYSPVGASQYILKEGDVVEWKYEKK